MFIPPLVRPIRRPRPPLFHAHARRCSVGLEIGRVDHHGLLFTELGGQAGHHSSEDALVAPPFPTVVQRLMRPIENASITSPHPFEIDEDNATQYAPIIDKRLAVRLREDRFKTRHLRIAQPQKFRHDHNSIFEP